MSSQKKYLRFHSIQERLKCYLDQTGQYITFSQAVQDLVQEGRVLPAPTPCPSFSSWDVSDPHQLYELCSQTSVEISSRSTFFSTLNGNDLLAAFFKNCLYSDIQGYLLFMIPPSPELCGIIKCIFTEYYGKLKNANAICCSYVSIFFSLVLRLYSNTYLQYSSDDSIMSQMPAILTYIQAAVRTAP